MNNKELIFTLKCLSEQTINDKIKLDLLDIEKELKVLDIIKNKLFKIDFKYLICSSDYDVYCFFTCYVEGGLTKEEFESLREVLLCQQ